MNNVIGICASKDFCIRTLFENINIPETYTLLILIDNRYDILKFDSFKQMIESLIPNHNKIYVESRKVIDFYSSIVGDTLKHPEIIWDHGPMIKNLFYPFVYHTMGIEKMLLLDDDIFILNDPKEIFRYEYAYKRDPFQKGGFLKYIDMMNDIFGTTYKELDHVNNGHILMTYDLDYEKYLLDFLNHKDTLDLYNNREKSKGKFFFMEQAFMSFFMRYIKDKGKTTSVFKNKEVRIIFNETHDKKIANYCVIHYPIKNKQRAIKHVLEGLNEK